MVCPDCERDVQLVALLYPYMHIGVYRCTVCHMREVGKLIEESESTSVIGYHIMPMCTPEELEGKLEEMNNELDNELGEEDEQD